MLRRNRFFSNAGSRVHLTRSPVVRDDGRIEIVVSGKEDLDARIQASAAGCDIQVILARYAAGDVSALQVNVPQFGDFTSAPSSLAQALQLRIDTDKVFDSLDPAIKELFGNSKDVFFATAGSADWYDKLGVKLVDPEVDNVIVPDVKEAVVSEP